MQVTNCHIHTFTVKQVPDPYAGILGHLLRIRPLRRALLAVVRLIDRPPRNRFARYARILEISHRRSQEDIFKIVRGFHPQGTRFVWGEVSRKVEHAADDLSTAGAPLLLRTVSALGKLMIP